MNGVQGRIGAEDCLTTEVLVAHGDPLWEAHIPGGAIHVREAQHATAEDLRGTFNVCDNDNLPASNQRVFDAICLEGGMQKLEFLDQIKAPLKQISAQKIYDTGYRVKHSDPNAGVVARQEAS